MTRLPDFFVIGANKGGTTSLDHYLGHHPQIYMSPRKEPHYFSLSDRRKEDIPESWPYRHLLVPDWNEYLALFENAGDALAVGESSTGYLSSEVAPKAIHDRIPGARLIAVLRHPVDRAYSNWLMYRRIKVEPLWDFEAALESEPERRRKDWPDGFYYRQLSLYGQSLQRWYDLFPAEQIRVYPYERLRDHPRELLRDVFTFLGVDPAVEFDISERLNAAPRPPRVASLARLRRRTSGPVGLAKKVLPKSVRAGIGATLDSVNTVAPELPRGTRRRLVADFKEDLALLDRLTGGDFSRWAED
jgi:hypothetical protein